MNILFVLYGDFSSNSANPLALYARELQLIGHSCAIAVPANLEKSIGLYEDRAFIPVLYDGVLAAPDSVFPDGRRADVIHACTPREVVRRFVTVYMAKHPTPLAIYLEDNECWIAKQALGLDDDSLARETDLSIAERLPDALSHPFRYGSFIGLADAVAVIQDKLKSEVPPWVHCETVMLGVDLESFHPQPANVLLRNQYGIAETERVIVYHGGANSFTKPALETLCRAVGIINDQGHPCRLLRTGPFTLDFLGQLPGAAASAISDLGVVPKRDLPGLLALADLFVQPGKIDPFEDLRLPGKIPEFLAMGRPVIMPDVGIAYLFQDGVDAVLLGRGDADEIASKCLELFARPRYAEEIGMAGRRLAEKYFDARFQARRLESLYKIACDRFNPSIAREAWRDTTQSTPMPLLLSRKLRLLADLDHVKLECSAKNLLLEHSRHIELMQQRVSGMGKALDAGTVTLRQVIAERREAIRTMLASGSWRLTYLLRLVKSNLPSRVVAFLRSESCFTNRMLLVPQRFGEVLKTALQHSGGIGSALNKTLALFKKEGWKGLRLKWRHLHTRIMEYIEWIRRYDTLTDEGRVIIRRRIEALSHKPSFSVIMPTYNTNPQWLIEAIESVRKQLYPYWELCIADDASTDPSVRSVLERYATQDPRIKVVFRQTNGHISAASNSALELANGEYIAFLDHDDLLAEHALSCMAEIIARNPDVCIIYSDEDKVDNAGRRSTPYFKCDWNQDLFYSHNLICHLGVYRTDLVRDVGGFRLGYEGAQDYDLALRCIERIAPKNILHIPRVLYHWRMHPGSMAAEGAAKPYALMAGEKALGEHLKRRGIDGRAESLAKLGVYRVHYPLPDSPPMVSLIVLARNGLESLRRCIESILQKTTYPNYEILILDNRLGDEQTIDYLKSLKTNSNIRVVQDHRVFNFSALNNAGVELARGALIGLLSNDIEVISPGWLTEMVSHALRADVGVVGAKLLCPNGTVHHAGIILGIGGVAGHAHKGLDRNLNGYFCRAMVIQSLSAVTAACLVIRKEIFEKVGGMNEDLLVAFNDVDFCLRVREAGYRNVWTPYAELYHRKFATRRYEDTPQKQVQFEKEVKYMKQRWGDLLINDPAYSPNLTLDRHDFGLAETPRVAPLS
jgi:GT2 family glycosyltransferase/glycosyltransferase involved in cell wall biosynthesis